MGVSVGYAYPAPTGLTIVNQLSGAVEYVPASAFVPGSSSGFSAPLACQQSGQVLTCRNVPYGFESPLYFWMRSTGPGPITHTATVRADQPDPFPADNTASIGNTAVSLAALSLKATSAIGGKSVLARATLTSPCPWGGARVTLASSNPAVAAVPTPFDVQRGCCDNGLWREFYVRTTAVSVPTTVQISATYGLVTKVVPLTVMPPQQSYGGTPWNLPGIVQAENFDGGGEGVAYHDTSAGNSGGAYRATGVDLQTTRDTGGGVNVGWISAGEWLEYTVKLASGGSYLFAARVASPGAGGTFHVEMDDVNKTGTLSIPDTGGWQTWTTISRAVTLDAGTHVLRIAFDSVGSTGAVGNLNYVQFTSSAGTPTPYGGVPRSVPGTVQAEDFDEGGEGVAYHDTTSGNAGGQYRATRVDIQRTTDLGGGYNVGWMAPGEWLNYTVSVATAGTYTLKARVGADGPGGTFHVTLGGRDVTGPLTIPDTGGWQRWTDVAATVTLQAGVQWIRFVADGAGATGVFGNLGFITVEPATDVPR
jgi:hypothetical protein